MSFDDPNEKGLVDEVSRQKMKEICVDGPQGSREGKGNKTIILIDCGVKKNIIRSLLVRGVKVITVPWNFDIFSLKGKD